MNVKIKLVEGGKLPEYKTSGSVGADCFARLDEILIIMPEKVAKVPLGFSVEIPEGYELQVRGRSGKSKDGFFTPTGTIDQDYRGEVCAILYNSSNYSLIINNGDRIAQAVIAPIIKAEWEVVDKLSDTERGINGFGSTGK